MANDIGPLTTKITASTAGLEKALDKAPGIVKGKAGKIEAASKQAGEKAGEAAGIGWAGKFGLAMLGGAAAGGAGVVGIAALYSSGADSIREIGVAAAGAAMPVSEFQGLVSAFSGNAQDATDAAVKLSAALSKAALTGEGGDMFARLGLDPADMLASKNAFEEFADSIASLPTGFAQVQAALSVFGEDYKKFLPILQRGGGYIREQKSILEGFGAGITGGMVDSVQRADRMFAQLAALWQGLKIQVTAGLAPVIAAITETIPRLDKLGITFKGLGGYILEGAIGAAKFGSAVYEAFTNPEARRALFDLFGEAANYLGQKITQALTSGIGGALKAVGSSLAGPFAELIARNPTLLASGVGKWFAGDVLPWLGLLDKAGSRLDTAAAGAGAASSVSAAGVARSWDALLGALAKGPAAAVIKEFSDRARDIYGGVGLSPMADQSPQIWLETARKMAEALDNPIQKFTDAIDRVQRLQDTRPGGLMLAAGMVPENQLPWNAGRSWIVDPMNPGADLAGAAAAMLDEAGLLTAGKAVQDLLAGAGSTGPQFAGAMTAGSREAYSAILAAQYQGRESIQEQIEAAIERGNKQRERQLELGRQGLEAMRNMKAVKVGGLD